MGKISVAQFISLDGVIEAPHTWHFPYISDDMQADVNANIHASEAFLLGSVTYSGFAEFWPTQTNNEFGIADKLNNAPKYVVSNSLKTADWNNSFIISGRLEDEIPKLKAKVNGLIGITGSARLILSLMEADLIDEYRLMVHPIVVGKGVRLFPDGIKTVPLKLVENKVYSSGVTLQVYEPAR